MGREVRVCKCQTTADKAELASQLSVHAAQPATHPLGWQVFKFSPYIWLGSSLYSLKVKECVVRCEEERGGLTLRSSNVRKRRRVGLVFLRHCSSFHSLATKYVRQMLTGDVTGVGMVAADGSGF